jgi:hypothetical protein
MEAIYFSETSIAAQQTTWRHIPEDDTLHLPLHTILVSTFYEWLPKSLFYLSTPKNWFIEYSYIYHIVIIDTNVHKLSSSNRTN